MPIIVASGSGIPADRVPGQNVIRPSGVSNDACGYYNPNIPEIIVYTHTFSGVRCDRKSVFVHEVMHAAGLVHGDGGVMNDWTIIGGQAKHPGINTSNCAQIDHRAGPPDYDNDGNPNTPIMLDTGGRAGIITTGTSNPVLFDLT